MSTGYQIQEQGKLHYTTMQVVYWIDVFTRQRYRDIFTDSLRYCQKEKGLAIFAFVVMSNHVHLIVRSEPENLSQTIGDLKRLQARRSSNQ